MVRARPEELRRVGPVDSPPAAPSSQDDGAFLAAWRRYWTPGTLGIVAKPASSSSSVGTWSSISPRLNLS